MGADPTAEPMTLDLARHILDEPFSEDWPRRAAFALRWALARLAEAQRDAAVAEAKALRAALVKASSVLTALATTDTPDEAWYHRPKAIYLQTEISAALALAHAPPAPRSAAPKSANIEAPHV